MVDCMSMEIGAEVAVMPLGKSSASDVIEISKVNHVRAFTIQLTNGRLYARKDGRGLTTNDCIAPATDEHRLALKAKGE